MTLHSYIFLIIAQYNCIFKVFIFCNCNLFISRNMTYCTYLENADLTLLQFYLLELQRYNLHCDYVFCNMTLYLQNVIE